MTKSLLNSQPPNKLTMKLLHHHHKDINETVVLVFTSETSEVHLRTSIIGRLNKHSVLGVLFELSQATNMNDEKRELALPITLANSPQVLKVAKFYGFVITSYQWTKNINVTPAMSDLQIQHHFWTMKDEDLYHSGNVSAFLRRSNAVHNLPTKSD